ncbi:Hypothetical protein Cp262_2245 [Corynebacterium pseudotuberculosis]|nr:Hypothetical protein Cp262_2245 [Corynebacterium pseudotuberculosis]
MHNLKGVVLIVFVAMSVSGVESAFLLSIIGIAQGGRCDGLGVTELFGEGSKPGYLWWSLPTKGRVLT